MALSSNIKNVFLTPSAVKLTASKTPPIGFITKPLTPLNNPVNNPYAPCFYISSTGFVNTPVIPLNTPLPKLITPFPTPSNTFLGLLTLSLFLSLKY